MTSAAHDEPYGDPRWRYRPHGPGNFWGGGCWGWGRQDASWTSRNGDASWSSQSWGPSWGPGHPFFWAPHFIPRPVLILLTILGFMLWWPIGVVLLTVMIWRKAMFCAYRRHGGWQGAAGASAAGWKNWFGGDHPPSSGNRAFDEYRAETLRRLEEEQKEFAEFLERLRFAKDKAEFDQFMNERRNRPQTPPSDQPAGTPG
jgi:hypothetical protein